MFRRQNQVSSVGLLLVMTLGLSGCLDEKDGGLMWDASVNIPEVTVPNSLHGTTRGMEYWYSQEQNGFEQFTGVPYEDLACGGCHTTCQSCHEGEPGATPVSDDKCRWDGTQKPSSLA